MSPPDAPRYEIRTVADFDKVPPKRLRACLKEFAIAVELHRRTRKLLDAIEESMGAPDKTHWPLDCFTWIDDKAKHFTVKLVTHPVSSDGGQGA